MVLRAAVEIVPFAKGCVGREQLNDAASARACAGLTAGGTVADAVYWFKLSYCCSSVAIVRQSEEGGGGLRHRLDVFSCFASRNIAVSCCRIEPQLHPVTQLVYCRVPERCDS